MKFFLTSCLAVFISLNVSSQVTVGTPEYDNLKANGLLDGVKPVTNPSLFDPVGSGYRPNLPTSTGGGGARSACDCYSQPDASYTLAMLPNDDGSSALINIPFDFCFYGQTYNSFYINNNGNITFTSILSAFSSTAFPSAGNQILAPFWADVDTRPLTPGGPGNGEVWYKVTPTAVYINWEAVGYYSLQDDKLNTFQLIITDGADPVVSGGNVAFCYQDMQWTTGSASSGVGGFGGIPATCGANKGDGIGYFLIAQFDHAGADFDGALGAPDGISWLDNKSFYFDACNTSNIPPIAEGVSSCDTFRVCSFGDTADVSINFLSPEISQSTSITWTNGGLASLQEIANIPGNTAQLVLRIIGNPAEAGTYTITVTATDDFAPTPGVTTITFTIVIEDSPVAIDPILTPIEGCDSILVSVLNGPYDTYLWDDFDNTSTNYISQSGVQGVTVSLNGCYKRVDTLFTISTAPFFNLQGTLNVCPTELANVYIPDSTNLDSITWYLATPSLDSLFSNSFGTGTYNVTIWDSSGYCQADTSFTVTVATAAFIFADDTLCNGVLDYQVTGLGANPAGLWESTSPEISFSDPNGLNPLITTTATGTYTVTYTNSCDTLTATLTFASPPSIFADTSVCSLSYVVTGTVVDNTGGVWSTSDTEISFSTSNTLDNPTINATTSGVYNVTFTDNVCGVSDQAQIELVGPPSINLTSPSCNYVLDINGTQSYYNGLWSASDTSVNFNATNILNPDVWVTNPGTYTLTFTDTVCNQIVSQVVEFPPYAWTEVLDTVICFGSEYLIYANENWTIDNYVWNTGETGPSILVTQAGDYTVTGSNICHTVEATATIGIKFCDIAAPNVISLSSESGNNFWFVDFEGVTQFDCTILNRWGNLIYQYNDPAAGWDGRTMGGNFVEEGVYFYVIKAAFEGGHEITKHGTIQVVH